MIELCCEYLSVRCIWLVSFRLWTKWLWVRVQLQSLKNSDFAPASGKEFLDIQATIECGFTLNRVRDMIRAYNHMHRTDQYSKHSSIIRPVWPHGWVFVYELSSCGFESSYRHLKKLRFCACFEQGVPWHSGNYRKRIHSETRTWHDKNMQSISQHSVMLFYSVSLKSFMEFKICVLLWLSEWITAWRNEGMNQWTNERTNEWHKLTSSMISMRCNSTEVFQESQTYGKQHKY